MTTIEEAFRNHCQRPSCKHMAAHPASLCEWLDKNPDKRVEHKCDDPDCECHQ